MKLTTTAAILTIVLSLLNLPAGLTADGVPGGVAWGLSVFGVAGLVAGIAALRRASWGPIAVLAVGVINLVGSIVALITDEQGAVVGIVISAAIVAAMLSFFVNDRQRTSAIATSR